MQDAKNKRISLVICYRLDRISRNIGDFAKLIEELNSLEISFVSVKEQFDTASPMGRAMMYIASVFSQLERETIAERIRDNMLELAKTGRWLGGNTPTGYCSQAEEIVSISGKNTKTYKLSQNTKELETVKLIFEKYAALKSLTKVETYLCQHHIKSKNNNYFTRFAIKAILENPVYMIADKDAYKFFMDRELELYSSESEFNGEFGVMAYNKTLQKKGRTNKTRELNEWIITVGKHKGIISGVEWINIWRLLVENKNKSYRKPKSNLALLSGFLYCTCGSYMRPKKTQRMNHKGEFVFSYICEVKEKSKGFNCCSKNINGNLLDEYICSLLTEISTDKKLLFNQLQLVKSKLDKLEDKNEDYQRNLLLIKETEKEIENLVYALARADENTVNYINQRISQLHLKKKELEGLEIENNRTSLSKKEINERADFIYSLKELFPVLTVDFKRQYIREFINKIVWDGVNARVYLREIVLDEEN